MAAAQNIFLNTYRPSLVCYNDLPAVSPGTRTTGRYARMRKVWPRAFTYPPVTHYLPPPPRCLPPPTACLYRALVDITCLPASTARHTRVLYHALHTLHAARCHFPAAPHFNQHTRQACAVGEAGRGAALPDVVQRQGADSLTVAGRRLLAVISWHGRRRGV